MVAEHVQHPGVALLQHYLQPLGITPSQLAEAIDLAVDPVTELLEGRRPVTPDMAARLALFFDVPSRWWLIHQARYDAEHVAPVERLRDIVKPYEGLSEVLVTPNGVTRLSRSEAALAETRTAMVSLSEDCLARLRAQVGEIEEPPRTVVEKTFADGTVALTGE